MWYVHSSELWQQLQSAFAKVMLSGQLPQNLVDPPKNKYLLIVFRTNHEGKVEEEPIRHDLPKLAEIGNKYVEIFGLPDNPEAQALFEAIQFAAELFEAKVEGGEVHPRSKSQH